MSLSEYEHAPPNAYEVEQASETLSDVSRAERAFKEAHRALARAYLEAGVADKSGFRPPYRENLTAEEYVEGAAELALDTISNLKSIDRFVDLCVLAESEAE